MVHKRPVFLSIPGLQGLKDEVSISGKNRNALKVSNIFLFFFSQGFSFGGASTGGTVPSTGMSPHFF